MISNITLKTQHSLQAAQHVDAKYNVSAPLNKSFSTVQPNIQRDDSQPDDVNMEKVALAKTLLKQKNVNVNLDTLADSMINFHNGE